MDEYIAKRGRRIEERVGDREVIASVLTEIDQYDRAVEVEAGEALMRWLECSGGESGEEMAATQEEAEEIWFAAWEAGRAALLRRDADEALTGNPAIDEHARFEGQRLR